MSDCYCKIWSPGRPTPVDVYPVGLWASVPRWRVDRIGTRDCPGPVHLSEDFDRQEDAMSAAELLVRQHPEVHDKVLLTSCMH